MNKEKRCENIIHKTSIGGQAVIEGVMMRGPKDIAVAVRKPDGEIVVDKKPIGSIRRCKFFKLPIIRGVINFFDSMIIGIKALTFSAKFFDVDDDGNQVEEEPSKFEKWLEKHLGSEKAMNIAIYFSVVLSLFLSIGLFKILPTFLVGLVKNFTDSHIIFSLVEGLVKIVIFGGYLILVSQMKDMKRVFMYHGAEHKTINCYERGLDLTVDNVRTQTRMHPRCGTSFLIFVMLISIFISFFLPKDNIIVRMLLGLAFLPVVAGISYEVIKFAGRHDNRLTHILSAPGMWFQHITTNEPDDSQIEVAISSFLAVVPDNKEEDKW